ncbi:G-type lectin S-receptor-like serine/threonine-protein kinase At1g11300 isoform X2 [Trifolium pratense]|uniref:G-type lectin S-receptor-like serine/threonine-protein kinase At1g11300 isoform X2 n=1 Tax=Trifolium pratense TaxID=57577 RepID=UPI001E692D6C|nr:G-type lectin S-receptor-like serine/threonine-protein kinase At1g11300 isoform X2 [Trifolium pratense]
MAFLSHNINHLLITFIIFCSFCSCYSSINDTITLSKSLKDQDTITSNSTNFKLGFFSPINSTNRYLGIWYINETNNIWIANRDQPLKDSNGIVSIHKDGNLVILNKQKGDIIWSTNISTSTNSTAQLDDSGNLILRDINSGETIWDSFSHPADAAVPTMRIGANKITGKKITFVSRKSENDPSSGHFSASLERLDAPEVFIWHDKNIHWRTGPWNGRVFLGSPRMLTEYLFGWRLDHDGDGTDYITYNFADKTKFGILTLTYHGTLKLVEYINKTKFLSLEVDQNECDFYGKCGPFGNCDNSSVPICSCFEGFEPKNLVEWNLRNWTNGCVRKEGLNLKCEMLKINGSSELKQDGFLVHHFMKVPDFAKRLDGNQDECRKFCLTNCSCVAYAYDPYITCMYWTGELIDLQKFPYGGVDLFIRVPAELVADTVVSNSNKKEKGHKKSFLIIPIIVGIGAFILVICSFLWWKKSSTRDRGRQPRNSIIGEEKQMKLDELPLYDFEKLEIATNYFHFGNMLGKGGFGPVYKGVMEDGQEIAVKRLSKASGQGIEEFMNEVVVISKLQHRNLVRILGCCVERGEQMLVYEFMPNKSLDAFLFDPLQKKILDWKKRSNIIEGIARGILYLHRDSRLRIIHRDLKASNILLDGDMIPKIADFGLARIVKGGEEDEANTKRVVGTYGYMPPEYAMEGLFSEKSDVYSFGVLLLEIVSGRRNSSFNHNECSLSLVGFAWKLWLEENIISLIDPEVWDPYYESSMLRCIQIGLLCVQELPRERPNISNVVLMLISEITHLPPPGKVAFVHRQNSKSTESSQKSQQSSNSNNNVTLSDVQGR